MASTSNLYIALIGYKRPHYLERAIKAVLAMDGLPPDVPIRGFIDRLPDGSIDQNVVNVMEGHSISWTAPEQKAGCNGTIFMALSRCFNAGADAVLVVEDDIVASPDSFHYIIWALSEAKNMPEVRNIALWSAIEGYRGPTPMHENEAGRILKQSGKFSCWGWVALKREWDGMAKAWTKDTTDSDELSWDVVLERHFSTRYELAPSISRATNIGQENGTHRGACAPLHLAGFPEAHYWLDTTKKEKIYVILGRLGDIYMTAKAIREPSIICCSRRFSAVKQFFPEHKWEILEDSILDPLKAEGFMQMKYPDRRIIVCQLDQQPRELCKPFRNYQAFQQYHASL